MDLSNKNELLSYLKAQGLWAKKGLSQNFLVDKKALKKIVESAEIDLLDLIIEIGPGLGVLTTELLEKAGQVVAIEMDQTLANLLPDNSKLKVINSDVLKVNLNEVIRGRDYKVVANIPYHITSKILELFLSRENKPKSMVLLVQKEVAERVCAKPGEMSVLSASVQLYGKPEIVSIVPKESFFPSPKVDSAILKVSNVEPTDTDEKAFFRCVHIGFASRRKTLVNNISAGYRIDKNKASDIIRSIGIGENARAQELSIDSWKNLVKKMSVY